MQSPSTLMTLGWVVGAFAVFMALIWSVYALNRLSMARYGSEPFSPPNAALMLVVNLLLFSTLSGGNAPTDAALPVVGYDLGTLIKVAIATLLSLWLFVVIARRTSLWIALFAVPLMAVGAIAILPSLLFRYLAFAGSDSNGS
jgi:hypothetical protein